jgi:DMSO/TMAO reductase YedYZ molybdopterin-dependent catalytic subunit
MSIEFVDNREVSVHDGQSVDEGEYLATREEQFARRLARSGYSRREVLKLGVAGASLAAGIGHFVKPGVVRAATPSSPIVKPLPAEWFINYGTNAEMRWDSVSPLRYLTPNERFFVRDHTATPLIDAESWSLSLWGEGLRGAPTQNAPITLNYRQLRSLPSVEVPAFIECAGNGRSFFASEEGTPAAGTQWGLGAVGVASWRGVPLAEILERARVLPGTVDVMPQGLDADYVTGGVDYGHVRRPLPIAKAFKDAILAYEMNGQPLPPDNGFPVRLIVPGWVGIANIKWLGQIQVAKEPLFSYWNTTQYVLGGPDYPTPTPLTEQKVKSAFELAFNATLPNQRQVLAGRSWSGRAPIQRVDISTDGGSRWQPARLLSPNLPHAWVRWEFPWRPPGPGSYTLQARATDWAGHTQPATVPFNTGGYLFWAIVDHPVTVSS